MKNLVSISALLLIVAQLFCYMPDVVSANEDFSEKKTEKESSKDAEKEKEKEESSLNSINELTDKVITRFYIVKSGFSQNEKAFTVNTFYSFSVKENFYLWYSNLRI